MFFSPLWLLNFELLLKLLFPLQSYKRNYSIFSPVIFMAFFLYICLWSIWNLTCGLILLFLHCFLYQLLIIPLTCPLIWYVTFIIHSVLIYVYLGLFLNFMFCWPVCSFTYSILLIVEMKHGLYYLLKLIFPHCSFSDFSWLKFSLAFLSLSFY